MTLALLGFLHLSFVDIIDIVVLSVLIYVLFRSLKGSSAINIFIAIIFLFLLRIISGALNMKLLHSLLSTVIDVGAVALVVIFQPEIRQFLSRMGRSASKAGSRWQWLGKVIRKDADKLSADAIREITEACADMAEQKTGAIIVIRRLGSLQETVETGDRIDAEISSRLLENIFFKDSPLHDGAVIIGGNRIIAARCTLPISESRDIPPRFGMRHKAAVGITEKSDADVIVISEQRGKISFVREGKLYPIDSIYTLKNKLEESSAEEGK